MVVDLLVRLVLISLAFCLHTLRHVVADLALRSSLLLGGDLNLGLYCADGSCLDFLVADFSFDCLGFFGLNTSCFSLIHLID